MRKMLRKSMYESVLHGLKPRTIDAFVESIIVRKDHFEWNLRLADEPVCCNVEGNKRKSKVIPAEHTNGGEALHRQY
jgi:hypothetical protein